MRGVLAGLAVLAAVGAVAVGSAAAQSREAPDGRPVVHLCERGNYAERMLKREHGAAPYATAAEVLAAARGQAPGWTAPRCMTGLEFYRLDAAIRRTAEQRRIRAEAQRVLASR